MRFEEIRNYRNFLNVHSVQRILFFSLVLRLIRVDFFMVIIFLMLDKNEITIFPRRRVCFMPPRLLVWARFFASPSVETFVTSLHRLWTVRFVFEKHFLVQCIERCTGMHWGKSFGESLRKFLENQIQEIVMDSRRFTSSRLMTTHETLLSRNKSTKKSLYETHCSNVCAVMVHVRGIWVQLVFKKGSRDENCWRNECKVFLCAVVCYQDKFWSKVMLLRYFGDNQFFKRKT